MQSAPVAHAFLQAVVPHVYGAHDTVGGVTHRPEPSHVPAKLDVPAAQLAVPQLVLPVGAVHAEGFDPLQVVGPQVGSLPTDVQAARGATGGPLTVLQVPTLPVALHAWHWPAHA
jgi:hypothetical protein